MQPISRDAAAPRTASASRRFARCFDLGERQAGAAQPSKPRSRRTILERNGLTRSDAPLRPVPSTRRARCRVADRVDRAVVRLGLPCAQKLAPAARALLDDRDREQRQCEADRRPPITRGQPDSISPAYGDSVPRLVHAAGCAIWSPFWRNATRARIAESHAARSHGTAVTVNDPRHGTIDRRRRRRHHHRLS